MPTVSLVATLVATAFSFVLGGLWYGPLFGKPWMAENGFTEESIKAKGFNPVKMYGTTLIVSALASYVFGMFLGPNPALGFATGAGFAAGAFWVAGSFATSYLFEGKTMRHFLINGGYHVVQFTLIGLAFGLLG